MIHIVIGTIIIVFSTLVSHVLCNIPRIINQIINNKKNIILNKINVWYIKNTIWLPLNTKTKKKLNKWERLEIIGIANIRQ